MLFRSEIAWLIAWNIAAGEWSRVDLKEEQGRGFVHNLFSKLSGDLLSTAEEAWRVLQRCLMALRREGFEDIQQEAPFSRYALSNMLALARAWMEGGETGLLRKWADVFAPGWEARRPRQEPFGIIVDTGDSEEHALEVRGAPDRKTRIRVARQPIDPPRPDVAGIGRTGRCFETHPEARSTGICSTRSESRGNMEGIPRA